MKKTVKKYINIINTIPTRQSMKGAACLDVTHENSVQELLDLNLDQDAAYSEVFRDMPHPYKNRDSSVDMATGYGLDNRGSNPDKGNNFISTSSRLALEANPASFPRGQSGRGMKLTTPSIPKVNNGGAIPSLPHMFSWRDI
jgi:hypothetical protein